jgi:hypothetical protein
MGRKYVALLILNFGVRWRQVIKIMLRPHLAPRKGFYYPLIIQYKTDWALQPGALYTRKSVIYRIRSNTVLWLSVHDFYSKMYRENTR